MTRPVKWRHRGRMRDWWLLVAVLVVGAWAGGRGATGRLALVGVEVFEPLRDGSVPAHRGRDQRHPAAVSGRVGERAGRVGVPRRQCWAVVAAVVLAYAVSSAFTPGAGAWYAHPVPGGRARGDQRRADRPRAQGHRRAGRAGVEPHSGRCGRGRHPGARRAGHRPQAGARGRRRGAQWRSPRGRSPCGTRSTSSSPDATVRLGTTILRSVSTSGGLNGSPRRKRRPHAVATQQRRDGL